MPRHPLKLGLLAVIILQIISIFYLLHFYNKFVSNPENYYKDFLTRAELPPTDGGKNQND
ncbi:MAG: hypothetical protein LiPW39_272 [Parcubacteria group bacterium LiPW_39]|nr:MAG: hypothetical protein LiPW39_272 [Parcubacteria group bacterium LiPW_39]